MSAQLSTLREQTSGQAERVPEATSARTEPTEITTRQRLVTLRLVREGSFPAPSGYPTTDIPIRSPRDVFDHMPADYFVKFVIRKWIWDGAEVVNDVGMCFRICIEADCARRFVPATSDVENFFAWSYR